VDIIKGRWLGKRNELSDQKSRKESNPTMLKCNRRRKKKYRAEGTDDERNALTEGKEKKKKHINARR